MKRPRPTTRVGVDGIPAMKVGDFAVRRSSLIPTPGAVRTVLLVQLVDPCPRARRGCPSGIGVGPASSENRTGCVRVSPAA
jgi:hypothetical protein